MQLITKFITDLLSIHKSIIVVSLVSLLIACGSSNDKSKTKSADENTAGDVTDVEDVHDNEELLEGILIAPTVAGLSYQTKSQSGTTGDDGQFYYKEGEFISFSLGSLVLGQALGADVITPSNISGVSLNSGDPILPIMLRFLHSIDDDCDSGNGVSINSSIRDASLDLVKTLPVTNFEFENDESISALIDASSCDAGLVSESAAIAQYENSIEEYFGAETDKVALITLPDETEPSIAVDSSGWILSVLESDDQSVSSFFGLYDTVNNEVHTLETNDQGLPLRIYFSNGVILEFRNHSENSVDIQFSNQDLSYDPVRINFGQAYLVDQADTKSRHLSNGASLQKTRFKSSSTGNKHISGALEDGVTALEYADLAVKVHAAIVNSDFQAGKASFKLAKGVLSSVGESALILTGQYALGLNADERRAVDMLINAAKCAAPNTDLVACGHFMKDSVESLIEAGQLGYEWYKDGDTWEENQKAWEEFQANDLPPTVYLDRSMDGKTFRLGETLTFNAKAHDPNDGSTLSSHRIEWYINDGYVDYGFSLTKSDLPVGRHKISISVDPLIDGEPVIKKHLFLTIGNEKPTVEITNPVNKHVVAANDTVILSAIANDFEDEQLGKTPELVWYNSKDEVIGQGSSAGISVADTLNLPEEGSDQQTTNAVTVVATDSHGETSSAYIIILVGGEEGDEENEPPQVSINQPANNILVLPEDRLTLSASVTDKEDEQLSLPVSITWYNSQNMVIGEGSSIEISVVDTLKTPAEDSDQAVRDVVTVIATDSHGAESSASVSILIGNDEDAEAENEPPEVTIIEPTDNSVVSSGSLITFTANVVDWEDEQEDLTPSLTWYNSNNDVIGQGESISVLVSDHLNHSSSACSGSIGNTIRVVAKDSEGLESSDKVTVVVKGGVSNTDGLRVETTYYADNAGADTKFLQSEKYYDAYGDLVIQNSYTYTTEGYSYLFSEKIFENGEPIRDSSCSYVPEIDQTYLWIEEIFENGVIIEDNTYHPIDEASADTYLLYERLFENGVIVKDNHYAPIGEGSAETYLYYELIYENGAIFRDYTYVPISENSAETYLFFETIYENNERVKTNSYRSQPHSLKSTNIYEGGELVVTYDYDTDGQLVDTYYH